MKPAISQLQNQHTTVPHDKVTETIESLICELPPARQQTARRQLAKLMEESPTHHLLFELTLIKLNETQSGTHATPVAPTLTPALDLSKITEGLEGAKQSIVGEIAGIQKTLGTITRIGEDAAHTRICTNRMESKLDVLRPYRVKIAVITLCITLFTGIAIGWIGQNKYSDYKYNQEESAQ